MRNLAPAGHVQMVSKYAARDNNPHKGCVTQQDQSAIQASRSVEHDRLPEHLCLSNMETSKAMDAGKLDMSCKRKQTP